MPDYVATLKFSSALELSRRDIERLITNAIITEVGQAIRGDPIANVERTTLQILTIHDESGDEPPEQPFRQTFERHPAPRSTRQSQSHYRSSAFSDEPLIDEDDSE